MRSRTWSCRERTTTPQLSERCAHGSGITRERTRRYIFPLFVPQYRLTSVPPTPVKTLEDCQAIAKAEGLHYVYIGNVYGHIGANTYCPKCGKLIVKRQGFDTLENDIVSGSAGSAEKRSRGYGNEKYVVIKLIKVRDIIIAPFCRRFPYVHCLLFGCFASVAGEFYPAEKDQLSRDIDSYLKDFKVIKQEGDLLAIIVPHAGYQFSGRIAGAAFKQLTNKSYDTVIVMGPSHHMVFDGISIIPTGEYSTPLGKVKIDEEMARKLMSASPKITSSSYFFGRETSLP